MRRLALIGLVAAPLVLSTVGCATESPGSLASVSELREKYPTQLDLAKARGKCLNDRGWGVKVTDSAQLEATYPSNRQSEYEQDNRDCLLGLGIDPEAPTPERLVEAAYPQYKEGAACLIEAGWPVSSAPSLQRFKETYETQPWFPWSEIPTDDLARALDECPAPEASY